MMRVFMKWHESVATVIVMTIVSTVQCRFYSTVQLRII